MPARRTWRKLHLAVDENHQLISCELTTTEVGGPTAWQNQVGYFLRNYAELAVQRFKRIIGNTLKGRGLPQQKTEARIAATAFNRMTQLGMPISVKSSVLSLQARIRHACGLISHLRWVAGRASLNSSIIASLGPHHIRLSMSIFQASAHRWIESTWPNRSHRPSRPRYAQGLHQKS